MPEPLRSIASVLRAMNAHLAYSADSLRTSGEAESSDAIRRACERLAELAAAIEEQAEAVVVADRTVADRMNNFLMSVQTAYDLLRNENGSSDVCHHLRQTVERGRSAVTDIRRVLSAI